MSMSCLACCECDCEWQGTDKPACEDYVPPSRLEDDEPPEVPADPVLERLSVLEAQAAECAAQIADLQRQWDDFCAAVVKAREGED